MIAVRDSRIEKVRAAGRRYGREAGAALRLAVLRSNRSVHQQIARAALLVLRLTQTGEFLSRRPQARPNLR
jgi:hypothetical protein